MYDAFTTRYTFACPRRGETRVRLSAFRALDRLPGAGHPAVFQVMFDCPCGCEHPGLVSDVELDWAPLGHSSERFLNLMTDRFESTEKELADLAVRRPRPVFPSSFFLLAPGDGSLGLAVRCPACEHVSVNLVTPEHVDLPFHNDREIGVLQHVLCGDAEEMVEEFRDELDSGCFDARRLGLD